jgi:adenylylsulfate kinase
MRDPKGLWATARAGRAPELPGGSLEYERPVAPEVVAHGGADDAAIDTAAALLGAGTAPWERRTRRRA